MIILFLSFRFEVSSFKKVQQRHFSQTWYVCWFVHFAPPHSAKYWATVGNFVPASLSHQEPPQAIHCIQWLFPCIIWNSGRECALCVWCAFKPSQEVLGLRFPVLYNHRPVSYPSFGIYRIYTPKNYFWNGWWSSSTPSMWSSSTCRMGSFEERNWSFIQCFQKSIALMNEYHFYIWWHPIWCVLIISFCSNSVSPYENRNMFPLENWNMFPFHSTED